jgi:hypothetical protein
MKRILILLAAIATPIFAWHGHEVKNENYKAFIDKIEDVKDPSKPSTVKIVLTNLTEKPTKATVKLHKFVDDWKAVGKSAETLELPANGMAETTFEIVSGPFVFNALYPVHALVTFDNGDTLAPVRIFEVKATPAKATADTKTLPKLKTVNMLDNSSLSLVSNIANASCAWVYDKSDDITYKTPGWTGTDTISRAVFNPRNITQTLDGEKLTLPTIDIHPPYMPKGGSSYIYYSIKLPETKPIILDFYTSQRESSTTEPQSDGVTFRVWAAEEGQMLQTVFDEHRNTRYWMPGQADLSHLAGKSIILRLESHPGPENNTSVDTSFWGFPTIVAGKPTTVLEGDAPLPLETIAKSNENPVIIEGNFGLLDAWIAFKYNGKIAAFRGFDINIDDAPLVKKGSPFKFLGMKKEGNKFIHQFQSTEKTFTLTIEKKTAPGFVNAQFHFMADNAFISSIGLGRWNESIETLYYGHGYVLPNPPETYLGFQGHVLSTSHVGFQFKDIAILHAIDYPPYAMNVSPTSKTATLLSKDNCTFTIVAEDTAFNAAIQYRKLMDKKPAPAFKRLAGRFIFDIWGGTVKSIHKNMEEAIRYGLTDSLLSMHNWQRWGYDYRLPDIWPPRETFGSIEEINNLGKLLDQHDIPWGFHDNYIDFYPDADEYSFKNITFHRSGTPRKAWFYRDIQSFQFRPDKIDRFVKRNYDLMTKDVKPSHVFIDVFTSANCFDFYDHEGNYHPMIETRKCWGEAFAYIRNKFGGNAPTTSEAGHDQLIGYLDGSDCQWLPLSDKPGKSISAIKNLETWERVPWAAAVNHDKFALLGVGYSTRYQGGKSRAKHGINSDDYISMEFLSGHNPFVDAGSWGYNAVRKYWLEHDFARSIAARSIVKHEFLDNSISKQRVTWDNGAIVTVNRSANDWTVEGRTLPQYGYIARFPDGEAALLKDENGNLKEYATYKNTAFYNARNAGMASAKNTVLAEPSVTNFVDHGNGKFSYDLNWDVQKAPAYDFTTFIHFMDSKDDSSILFQDDHVETPTSQWKAGKFSISRTVTVPKKVTQNEFVLVSGLYTNEHGRQQLRGTPYKGLAINMGVIKATRKPDGSVDKLTIEPPPPSSDVAITTDNPQETFIDFGPVKTNGTFKVVKENDGFTIIVPPGIIPDFKATFKLDQLLAKATGKLEITAVPIDPEIKPDFKAEQNGKLLNMTINPTTVFSITATIK